LIRDLQAQVQTLNSQLSELRTEEQRTSEEARDLRRELDLAKGQMPSTSNAALESSSVSSAASSSVGRKVYPPPQAGQLRPGRLSLRRIKRFPNSSSRSEEDQQLIEGKLNDLYQTKVESGVKI